MQSYVLKPPLIFLCHRIPYPPNKGDKIRSYHVLKYLSSKYRIFLGAFIDDPADWKYKKDVDQFCEETFFVRLTPLWAKIRSLKGLVFGQPLTLPYYSEKSLQKWVEKTAEKERVTQVLVYSSSMAQYVLNPAYADSTRVIDLVDVDSDKWRQYAAKKNWPFNWVFRREADRLQEYERQITKSFDACLLVSRQEAALFRELSPAAGDRISYFRNGVDIDTFDPALDYKDPYDQTSSPVVVFTGAMDYWPNEDAVSWFVDEVFSRLKAKWPGVQFYIVGSRPTEKVLALAQVEGVEVTGRVSDVRPYLKYSTAIVVPIHIARGIQNKVLEAMAMAKPVVVTSMGLEGIDAEDGAEVLVADQADQFIEKLSAVFEGKTSGLGSKAREKICEEFSWEGSLPELDRWISQGISIGKAED